MLGHYLRFRGGIPLVDDFERLFDDLRVGTSFPVVRLLPGLAAGKGCA
jgi:hypothetical protein